MPPTRRRRRPVRWLVAVAVALAALAVTVVVSFDEPDRTAAFLRACLRRPGASVVVVSSSSHAPAMGAPEIEYLLGCRAADGRITATIRSNRR